MADTDPASGAPERSDGFASPRPEHDTQGRRAGSRADAAVRLGLDSLYHAHYVSLVRLAALLTGDAIVAEEVAADSLAALLTGPFSARLTKPALFRLHRQVVIRSRRAARSRQDSRRAPPDYGSRTAAVSAGWRSAPVVGLLASLSASQREAIVLRHYLELTEEETAAVMGASLRVVRRSLEAARQVLCAVIPDGPDSCPT